jgi:uncharacterized hydrophobic protein (TIGR00271 family)
VLSRRGSRWFALARGLGALAVVAILTATAVITHQAHLPLDLLITLFGFYLGFRGLVTLVSTAVQRSRPHRSLRAAEALALLAVGVLATQAPQDTVDSLILSGAITALVLGSLVLAYGLRLTGDTTVDLVTASVSEIIWDWIDRTDIGAMRRENLSESLYFEIPGRSAKLTAWWVMLALSVAIATYGVMQDSTAVVIGAMIIAPLMTPILGLAGALVNGWRQRAMYSGIWVAAGAAAAIALSYALSAWAPAVVDFDNNTQISTRVTPTVLDMLVAIAAGAAGAFATVNARVAASIAGVAIAVALVPPLAVVGISLGARELENASGAFLLFMTNFVAIVLFASLVFVLGGFADASHLRSNGRDVIVTITPFVALATVVLVPLMFNSEGLLSASAQQREAQGTVEDWLGEDTDLTIAHVDVRPDVVEVALLGPDEPPDLHELQNALAESLDRDVSVTLTVTPTTVTRFPSPTSTP